MTPLALYVHIPFCSSKCHYCAFSVVTQQEQQEAYIDELLREWEARRPDAPIDTLYIGGGTPSLLDRPLLEKLFHTLPHPPEITIECNPEQVTPDFVSFLQDIGVTRISLGVQTLQQHVLDAMNRAHSVEQAHTALRTLQASSLSWNADMILSLPGVTQAQFLEELETILTYKPPHISCYFLSVEPGTVLSRNYQASDDDVELYRKVCYRLGREFDHTEISNWARPGHTCKHNLHYWHGDAYLGIGLSASSYMHNALSTNTRNLQVYLQGRWQSEESVPLSRIERVELLLTSSTRLREGLAWSKISALCTPPELERLRSTAQRLVHQGLLIQETPNIILSETAYPLHNAIVRELTNSLELR